MLLVAGVQYSLSPEITNNNYSSLSLDIAQRSEVNFCGIFVVFWSLYCIIHPIWLCTIYLISIPVYYITSGLWPRVRARALCAPVFFCSLPCPTGRCAAPAYRSFSASYLSPKACPQARPRSARGVYLSIGLTCTLRNQIASYWATLNLPELRCPLMSYTASYWATLYPLSYDACNWATLHSISATLHQRAMLHLLC